MADLATRYSKHGCDVGIFFYKSMPLPVSHVWTVRSKDGMTSAEGLCGSEEHAREHAEIVSRAIGSFWREK